MATRDRRHTLEEVCQRGMEIFEQQIMPKLHPSDHGKFVAIDTLSGEYELDENDYSSIMKMRARIPNAEIFLARAGHRAAIVMRSPRFKSIE